MGVDPPSPGTAGMNGLRVRLLGQPRLELDGQPLTRLMAVKHQALVFYLAAQDHPVLRHRLAALLWGQLDPGAARANLRVALSRLRRQLPDLLAIDGAAVGFATGAEVQVDLRELERVAANPAAAGHEAALAVARSWRGPFLDGFDLGDADEFDHWMAAARQRAARLAAALRAHLASQCEMQGRIGEAIEHLRAWLDIDDADEQAHMALMRLLASDGRRIAALAQYDVCRATLRDRLGTRPSADCYALYCRLHADAPASGPTHAQPARPDPAAPRPAPDRGPPADSAQSRRPEEERGGDPLPGREGDLPFEPSRLVGREGDIALLARTAPGSALPLADDRRPWRHRQDPGCRCVHGAAAEPVPGGHHLVQREGGRRTRRGCAGPTPGG